MANMLLLISLCKGETVLEDSWLTRESENTLHFEWESLLAIETADNILKVQLF